MRCSNAQQQIADLVAGELPFWRQGAVRRHCRICPVCGAEWERTRQLWAGLRNLAAASTSDAMRTAVFTELPQPAGAKPGMDIDDSISRKRQKTQEIAMQKRLAVATAAILVTTITGTLTAQMLRHNTAVGQTSDWRAADQQRLATLHEQMTSPETDAGNLESAKEMRARWKPWAVAHRDALCRMLQARPEDPASWQRVYTLLPAYLPNHGDGLTNAQLDFQGRPFTWQPVAKLDLQPATDPVQNRLKAQEWTVTNRRIQQNFAEFHDIMLSRSMRPGRNVSYYAFWVSGRITATTVTQIQTNSTNAGIMTTKTATGPITHEVCPPYDELLR